MTAVLNTTEISAPPNLYPGFINISLRALVPGTRLNCDLWLEAWSAAQQRVRLVTALKAGSEVAGGWLSKLIKEEVRNGFLSLDDLDRYQDYLLEHMHEHLFGQDPRLGHCLVYEQALCSIKSAMLDPRNGRRLARGAATVRQILETMWDDENTRDGLLRVLTGDKQLYTHSLNATLLGVGFAHSLGWSREQTEALGIALFFHDLGLMDKADGLLHHSMLCASRSDAEIRAHPLISERFLSKVTGLTMLTRDIVAQHHENLDGSGYPAGLKAQDLGPASRLARIIDFYESATSGCGSLEVVSPFGALRKMRFDMAAQLDQSLLESFVRFLGHL